VNFAARFAQFPTWNLIAWFVWALMFAVLEGLGVKYGKYATLTYLMLHTIPRWGLAMFVGWLLYHFLIQVSASK
jgi:hypothetical protein